MEVLNRAAIKKEARLFIGQNNRWGKMFLAYLPILLATGAVSVITTGTSVARQFSELFGGGYAAYDPALEFQISYNLFSLVDILLIPFVCAAAGYFLNHLRGFQPDWKSLYKEGAHFYGKYFVVGFLRELFIGLWSLLFIIPGIVKAYAWYMVPYIIHDNPTLDAKHAREISDCLTQGFKADLFVLELSFILWDMLVGVTGGIASIYVVPYQMTTKAMYYENLKAYAISTGRVAPEVFSPMPQGGAWGQGQNPYTNPQQQPYSAPNPANPYAQGFQAPPQEPYAQQPSVPGEQANTFTPPAPEDTFRPWDVPPGTGQTPPRPAQSAQPMQTPAAPAKEQTGEPINREEKEQDE